MVYRIINLPCFFHIFSDAFLLLLHPGLRNPLTLCRHIYLSTGQYYRSMSGASFLQIFRGFGSGIFNFTHCSHLCIIRLLDISATAPSSLLWQSSWQIRNIGYPFQHKKCLNCWQFKHFFVFPLNCKFGIILFILILSNNIITGECVWYLLWQH